MRLRHYQAPGFLEAKWNFVQIKWKFFVSGVWILFVRLVVVMAVAATNKNAAAMMMPTVAMRNGGDDDNDAKICPWKNTAEQAQPYHPKQQCEKD